MLGQPHQEWPVMLVWLGNTPSSPEEQTAVFDHLICGAWNTTMLGINKKRKRDLEELTKESWPWYDLQFSHCADSLKLDNSSWKYRAAVRLPLYGNMQTLVHRWRKFVIAGGGRIANWRTSGKDLPNLNLNSTSWNFVTTQKAKRAVYFRTW